MVLKEVRRKASSAIGIMIAMGENLVSPGSQFHLNNALLPMVSDCLPDVHFRVQKGYALLLIVAKLVSKCIVCCLLSYNF